MDLPRPIRILLILLGVTIVTGNIWRPFIGWPLMHGFQVWIWFVLGVLAILGGLSRDLRSMVIELIKSVT